MKFVFVDCDGLITYPAAVDRFLNPLVNHKGKEGRQVVFWTFSQEGSFIRKIQMLKPGLTGDEHQQFVNELLALPRITQEDYTFINEAIRSGNLGRLDESLKSFSSNRNFPIHPSPEEILERGRSWIGIEDQYGRKLKNPGLFLAEGDQGLLVESDGAYTLEDQNDQGRWVEIYRGEDYIEATAQLARIAGFSVFFVPEEIIRRELFYTHEDPVFSENWGQPKTMEGLALITLQWTVGTGEVEIRDLSRELKEKPRQNKEGGDFRGRRV